MNKEKTSISSRCWMYSAYNAACENAFSQDRFSPFIPGCFAQLCKAWSTSQREVTAAQCTSSWPFTTSSGSSIVVDGYLLWWLSEMIVVLANARPQCVRCAVLKNGRSWLHVTTDYRAVSCYMWRTGRCRSRFVEWHLQRLAGWVGIPSKQARRKKKREISLNSAFSFKRSALPWAMGKCFSPFTGLSLGCMRFLKLEGRQSFFLRHDHKEVVLVVAVYWLNSWSYLAILTLF